MEGMSIYDVLRELVTRIVWPTEDQLKRRIDAIDTAERNRMFGQEGDFSL